MVTNLPRAVESFSDSLQTPHTYPQAFITTVFVAEKIPRICFIKPLGLVVVLVKFTLCLRAEAAGSQHTGDGPGPPPPALQLFCIQRLWFLQLHVSLPETQSFTAHLPP